MRRTATVMLLLLAGAALRLSPAVAASQPGSGAGHRDVGESSSDWGGLPFWAWILIAVGGFLLLFGVIFATTRTRRSKPEPEAPPAADAPPRAAVDTGPIRELAVATFPHINGAEQAYAGAQLRDRDAIWLRETTFVEARRHGRLVVRGTFAGRYLNVESLDDPTPYGEIARAVVGTAFTDLHAEVPEGSSALLVLGSAPAVEAMARDLDGHEISRRHLSDQDAATLEAAAARAPVAAPPS